MYYKACFNPLLCVLLFMPSKILQTHFPPFTSITPYHRLAVRLWEHESGDMGVQYCWKVGCCMELHYKWGVHMELLTSFLS